MSEPAIKTSRARSKTPRKPKKSQIPFAIVLLGLIIAFGYYLSLESTVLPVFWGFGIIFGYVLQRSRFCFTAAFRDPCITGVTSVTRAVLVALGIATIGFAAVKFGVVLSGAEVTLNMRGVAPIGLPLVLGAVIFGIGMVIAGGCASGTIMRVGEGFSMQLLVLLFFVIGSLLGARSMEFFGRLNENAPRIFLPDVLGWFGALVTQLGIIVLLYIAAVKWQKKRTGSED